MPQTNRDRLASEIFALRSDVASLTERLNAVLATLPVLPPDATAAQAARTTGQVRGWFTAAEFAAMIGRHNQFVSDRCSSGVIKTLRGGKPYRIPLSEGIRWSTA